MPPIGTYKLVVRLLLSLGFKQDEESLTVHHQKHLYEWARDEDKHHFFLGKHKTTNVAAADEDGTLSYIYTMDEWESWQSRNIPAVGSVKKARITSPAQASLEAGSVRQAQASLEDGNMTEPNSPLDNGAGAAGDAEGSAGVEDGNVTEPDSPLDNGAVVPAVAIAIVIEDDVIDITDD